MQIEVECVSGTGTARVWTDPLTKEKCPAELNLAVQQLASVFLNRCDVSRVPQSQLIVEASRVR